LIDIDFQGMIRVIDCIEHLVKRPPDELVFPGEMDLVSCFADLATKLKEVGYDEKIPRSTRFSGSSVTSRLYFAPNRNRTVLKTIQPLMISPDKPTQCQFYTADKSYKPLISLKIFTKIVSDQLDISSNQ
jgi:hypothetical protein